jgi:hypothetical protein
MHVLPFFTVRALIFSPDGKMRLERPEEIYETPAEARAVCNAVLAAHRANSICSVVQVHNTFGGRVDVCDDY